MTGCQSGNSSFRAANVIPDIENLVPPEHVALRVFRSAEIDEILRLVSDQELADLLLNRVWLNISVLDTEASIVSEAIDRLRSPDHVRRHFGWARKALRWVVFASYREKRKEKQRVPGAGSLFGEEYMER